MGNLLTTVLFFPKPVDWPSTCSLARRVVLRVVECLRPPVKLPPTMEMVGSFLDTSSSPSVVVVVVEVLLLAEVGVGDDVSVEAEEAELPLGLAWVKGFGDTVETKRMNALLDSVPASNSSSSVSNSSTSSSSSFSVLVGNSPNRFLTLLLLSSSNFLFVPNGEFLLVF